MVLFPPIAFPWATLSDPNSLGRSIDRTQSLLLWKAVLLISFPKLFRAAIFSSIDCIWLNLFFRAEQLVYSSFALGSFFVPSVFRTDISQAYPSSIRSLESFLIYRSNLFHERLWHFPHFWRNLEFIFEASFPGESFTRFCRKNTFRKEIEIPSRIKLRWNHRYENISCFFFVEFLIHLYQIMRG